MNPQASPLPESTNRIFWPGPSPHGKSAAVTVPVGGDSTPVDILIVDDEPRNLTVLETVLDDPSYRIIRAESAEQALLALIANEFALLILDIQMPGMSGFELAQMIRKRKRNAQVPIIFLTAYYNEDQHVLEGYNTGAVDYLHKPVNPVVLRSKVSVFVQLYRKNLECGLANRSLLAEVVNRRRTEENLRELNERLEQRVIERTVALRDNESRLRYAANAAGLTYVEVDFQGAAVRTAENFRHVMGIPPPPDEPADFSSIMRLLLGRVVPEDAARVQEALGKLPEGKPVVKVDYRLVGDDQTERWIQSELSVEFNSSGEPLKTFLTNLDITDRKAAQEQLRMSEERFRQLADAMPQMVWTARPDGYLDYYNARWHEFTGFGAEGCGHITHWEPILHPDDMKGCYDAWAGSVEKGEAYLVEYRLWDRRGQRYCWHLGRALPVRDKEAQIIKWIGTCTDIDDQKRTEADLRRTNQALEQFAFAASHDLQEPLRNVAIYSELLEQHFDGKLNEEGTMFLGLIMEGSRRMGHLVSGLLEYTRSGDIDSQPAIADAEKVLEQVMKNLHRAIQESQATITHDILPSVSMNNIHLEQLLQNLIGNALKYKKDEEPARVHISAILQNNEWDFSVRDNGIGIAANFLSTIFGVFKRLHATREKYSGTGIGLAICHRIVETYGGRIWVESEPGEGSVFHFTIRVPEQV